MNETPLDLVDDCLSTLAVAIRWEMTAAEQVKNAAAIERHREYLKQCKEVIKFLRHIDYVATSYNSSMASDWTSSLPIEYLSLNYTAKLNNEMTSTVSAIRASFPDLFRERSYYFNDDDDS